MPAPHGAGHGRAHQHPFPALKIDLGRGRGTRRVQQRRRDTAAADQQQVVQVDHHQLRHTLWTQAAGLLVLVKLLDDARHLDGVGGRPNILPGAFSPGSMSTRLMLPDKSGQFPHTKSWLGGRYPSVSAVPSLPACMRESNQLSRKETAVS